MRKDEEFVRANWEYIDEGVLMIYIGDWASGNYVGTFSGWAAVAEFTRERLEEIRQLEADIEWAVDAAAFCFKSPDFGQRVRILARLEAALADLRKGMRTAPPSGTSRRSDD